MSVEDVVRSARIMAVDDVPGILSRLDRVFSAAGHTVEVFLDGESALASAQVNPPEVILLDIRMPDMDGFEVCRALKADARFKYIPIIFLTAMNDVDEKLLAFSLGGADYISKPFVNREVLARVTTHLRLYRLMQDSEERQRKVEQIVRERTQELERKSAKLLEQTRKLKEVNIAMDVVIRKLREDTEGRVEEALRRQSAEILPLVKTLEGLLVAGASSESGVMGVVARILDKLKRFPPDPLAALEQGDTGGLSYREMEIARLLVEGNSAGDVARELRISSRSVDSHCYNIRKKLKVPAKMRLRDYLIQELIVR